MRQRLAYPTVADVASRSTRPRLSMEAVEADRRTRGASSNATGSREILGHGQSTQSESSTGGESDGGGGGGRRAEDDRMHGAARSNSQGVDNAARVVSTPELPQQQRQHQHQHQQPAGRPAVHRHHSAVESGADVAPVATASRGHRGNVSQEQQQQTQQQQHHQQHQQPSQYPDSVGYGGSSISSTGQSATYIPGATVTGKHGTAGAEAPGARSDANGKAQRSSRAGVNNARSSVEEAPGGARVAGIARVEGAPDQSPRPTRTFVDSNGTRHPYKEGVGLHQLVKRIDGEELGRILLGLGDSETSKGNDSAVKNVRKGAGGVAGVCGGGAGAGGGSRMKRKHGGDGRGVSAGGAGMNGSSASAIVGGVGGVPRGEPDMPTMEHTAEDVAAIEYLKWELHGEGGGGKAGAGGTVNIRIVDINMISSTCVFLLLVL